MARERKTIDVWRLYVDYGSGWEHETTELTQGEMQTNRKAYAENCAYPVRIVRGRMLKTELSETELARVQAKKDAEAAESVERLLARARERWAARHPGQADQDRAESAEGPAGVQ